MNLTLYADDGIAGSAILALQTKAEFPSGWTGQTQVTKITRDHRMRAERLILVVDDDGTSTGTGAECSKGNNRVMETGPCRD